MKKLIILFVVFLATLNLVTAVVCNSPANTISSNPDESIVVCDDPQDSTCEQDFETLCPNDYHLCTADEYNAGNDNWAGTPSTWLLGEITCREGGGAGHYTVYGGSYSADVLQNQVAGSSLPQCQTDYGCNENQYLALCCIGAPGGNNNNEIPEFSSQGLALALVLGGATLIIIRKR
ncbi:MAG: hypothetical protein AABX51_00790 [Nanoarchaeota archaeon]|mgnify:CR=1 FL=1